MSLSSYPFLFLLFVLVKNLDVRSTFVHLVLKMMLSIFYLLLLLAAGSRASPCKPSSGNGTSSSGTGRTDTIHRNGQGSGAANGNQKLGLQGKAGLNLTSSSSQASAPPSNNSAINAGSNNPTSGSSGSSSSFGSGSGTSEISGSLTPASGTCPQGFLNTVFNTNAGQASGFPSTTWDTLTKHGISNWSVYNLAGLKSHFMFADRPFFPSGLLP